MAAASTLEMIRAVMLQCCLFFFSILFLNSVLCLYVVVIVWRLSRGARHASCVLNNGRLRENRVEDRESERGHTINNGEDYCAAAVCFTSGPASKQLSVVQ